MTCPVCGAAVSGLACERCIRRRGHAALVIQQALFREMVLDETVELRLSRRSRYGQYHIQLFNTDGAVAYCGDLLEPPQQTKRCAFGDMVRAHICEACLAAFDKVMLEAAS